MEEVIKRVEKFIQQNELLKHCDTLYVATSGGADSMALLSFMMNYTKNKKIQLCAIHVNHGIRGETADRDEKHVRDFCEKHNVKYIGFNVKKYNIEVPENPSEEWARIIRYNFFESLPGKNIRIATAHTMSDQVETMIFRMAHGGSGVSGLSGIPVQRGNYIRPFLCINRQEVEKLCEYYNIKYVTDETNLTDDYNRNKIRHNVVPILKEINPKFDESFEKIAERLREANDFINDFANFRLKTGQEIEDIKYKREVFIKSRPIIAKTMLMILIQKYTDVNEHLIDQIYRSIMSWTEEDTETFIKAYQLNDRYTINITSKYITIIDNKQEKDIKHIIKGVNTFGNMGYDFMVDLDYPKDEFEKKAKDIHNLCYYADADKIDISKCIIRARKEGDIFKPACRKEGKLVKFMRDIPLNDRDNVPIIEYQGKIIWVWGLGFTDGFTPNKYTKKIIKIAQISK